MFKHPTEITCTQGFLKQQLVMTFWIEKALIIQYAVFRDFGNVLSVTQPLIIIILNSYYIIWHYINKLVELQLQHCQTAPRWRINQHILQIHLLTLSQGALCQLMEHLCISPRTQCLLWATNSMIKIFLC